MVNGRRIIFDDRAAEVKDKDGITWWSLMKRKEFIEVPPHDAIEVNKKGKKVVEAYRLESGDYIFCKDTTNILPIPALIESESDEKKKKNLLEEWRKKNNIDKKNMIEGFQPFSTKQRLILINQIKKAQMRRSKGWQDYLLPLVGFGGLIIIVICLFIFWGDLAKPVLEMGEQQRAFAEIQLQTLEVIKNIESNTQTIQGGEGAPPD